MRRDRAGVLLFLVLLGSYLVTFGGHFYSGDGIEMARTGESLVFRGDLALQRGEGERAWGYPGRNGAFYGPYPLGQSLAEAPFIAAGAALTAPLPIEPDLKLKLRRAATVSANAFITAGLGWVLYLLALRLGYARGVAAGLGLMLGLGTMMLVYARQDFADPLTALALLVSVLFLRRHGDDGRRGWIVLAGLALGFSLFTKYQMVIYCPVVWAYMIFLRRDRRERGLAGLARDTLLLAGPVILFGLADLGVNYAKFGSFTSTGYEQEASPWAGLGHLPAGLYGFLLSPGKSLFLYNPLLLMWPFAIRPFHREHRSESLLVILATGVTLLFFSPLYWWHGDWAWGPRYLLPLVPLMVLSLAPLVRSAVRGTRLRRAFALLLVLAVVVNTLGMTVNFFFYLRALSDAGHVHDDWNFIPGLSPLAFHGHVILSDASEVLTGEPIDFVYRAWSDGKFRDTRIRMDAYAREGKIPDYFFFKPYDTRIERFGLAAAGLALIALTALAASRLRRELRT